MLDHVLLNIGPYVSCWTPGCLPASSAILYPRTVRYYKSQRPPQLIGRGRRSSDATVNYMTEYETAHHCFSDGNRDVVTTQLKRIILEKKSHVDFHSFSQLANEKTKRIKLTGIRKLVSFQLYRSKTWV
ncbi:hypothetical protein AMECASPLE_008857 [Ameca splendens]|uniref:Uncharacterized protein n=1 Tax=Ameca splendens TaxID=208324 RepID=A0ABV1A7G3_9TELE